MILCLRNILILLAPFPPSHIYMLVLLLHKIWSASLNQPPIYVLTNLFPAPAWESENKLEERMFFAVSKWFHWC